MFCKYCLFCVHDETENAAQMMAKKIKLKQISHFIIQLMHTT
jgi:hypothetical protein